MSGSRPPASQANRRAEAEADEAFLAALFHATHRASLAGLDPALADLLLHQQFRGQSASYRAAHPDGRFDIVEVDGQPVGRIVTGTGDGALRLVDVALLPEWRGRGIGTRLLRGLQTEAHAADMPLRLSVLGDNGAARRLYERLGFRAFDATETHVTLQWCP